MTTDIHEQKTAIRKQAHANRRAQENKDELSSAICQTFIQSPKTALFWSGL